MDLSAIYLPPGQVHFLYGFCASQKKLEELTLREGRLLRIQVDRDVERVAHLGQERQVALRKLDEETEAQKKKGWWGSALQYLLSVGELVGGLICLSRGYTGPGVALSGAGGIGFTNQLMHDTGGWKRLARIFVPSPEEKELQKKVANRMEMSLFLLSLGVGCSGWMWGANAGAFMGPGADFELVRSNFRTVMGFFQVGAKVNYAAAEKSIGDLHAKLRENEAHMTLTNLDIYHKSADADRIVKMNGEVSEELLRAVEMAFVPQD